MRGIVFESGCGINHRDSIGGIMWKHVDKALFAEARYGHQPVGVDRRPKQALETYRAIDLCCPGPVLQEPEIVNGVNKPCASEACRRKEIVGVNNVRIAKFAFEGRSRLAPEFLGLRVPMMRTDSEIAGSGEFIAANFRIINMVAERRIDNIVIDVVTFC